MNVFLLVFSSYDILYVLLFLSVLPSALYTVIIILIIINNNQQHNRYWYSVLLKLIWFDLQMKIKQRNYPHRLTADRNPK